MRVSVCGWHDSEYHNLLLCLSRWRRLTEIMYLHGVYSVRRGPPFASHMFKDCVCVTKPRSDCSYYIYLRLNFNFRLGWLVELFTQRLKWVCVCKWNSYICHMFGRQQLSQEPFVHSDSSQTTLNFKS